MFLKFHLMQQVLKCCVFLRESWAFNIYSLLFSVFVNLDIFYHQYVMFFGVNGEISWNSVLEVQYTTETGV